ncbi:hypothetical protein PLCT1_01185 [Planctomycetaceae bacterium]|nr:hypothetical protein PLCT1_01185 [Planctomycetaceae bacterium]
MSFLHGNRAAIFIIAAVNLLLWSATVTNGFVYDDNFILLGNRWIKDPGALGEVFTSSMMAFDPSRPPANTFRPMLYVVFMAENALFGLDPYWFHWLNVVLHAVNAVLVFSLASRLLGRDAARNAVPALFAALAFSVHTINSEVVNWVSASAELFFTFCVLFALRLHAGGEGAGRALGGAVLFFTALLFKETAAAFLPVAVLYDDSSGRRAKNWKAYCLYIAAAAAYAVLRFNAVGGIMHHKQADLSAVEAFINVFPLIAAYAGKLLLPINLSAIYDFHPARSFADWRVVAGAAIALAFFLALFLSRRGLALFLGLAIMAIPLLPVLYVPALSSSAMADRYLYLPSAGFAIALAAVASRFDRKAGRAALVFGAVLLAAWAAGSFSRSQAWKSDRTLWADAVEKAPNTPNAHYNYAWASHNAGDTRTAVEHYRRAAAMAPSADAHYNLGVIYMSQSMMDESEREFRAALAVDPSYEAARMRLLELARLREAGL